MDPPGQADSSSGPGGLGRGSRQVRSVFAVWSLTVERHGVVRMAVVLINKRAWGRGGEGEQNLLFRSPHPRGNIDIPSFPSPSQLKE